MASIRLSSDTGSQTGSFWLHFVVAFIGMIFAGEAMAWLDVRLPVPENMFLRAGVFLLFAGASYSAMITATLALGRIFTLVFAVAEAAARAGLASLEWLLTKGVELGVAVAVTAIRLPAAPVRFVARLGHAWLIAPALERRRQRIELRRLYEEVRGDYASYEEFVRHFETGSRDTDAGVGEDASGNAGAQDNPEPAPVDKFVVACRTLGLSETGAFTLAELKARYHELMKAVHPDVIGPNESASAINEAREIIKARKGWK
ncbi:heat shock protein DnaJ domain protein [Rhizobium etli CNPAF512]|nr:heat shock protein DnaJ domain protein [Rhizobium etli CNPAF512]